jgi:aminoglycoside/choline kinase family phosphotransferase
MREEQQGFRKNRSTTDAIFIMRQVKEKAIEYNKPVYACFVDMTKAFDRVRLKDVVEILTEWQIPKAVIKSVIEMNTNCLMKITSKSKKKSFFKSMLYASITPLD